MALSRGAVPRCQPTLLLTVAMQVVLITRSGYYGLHTSLGAGSLAVQVSK